MGEKKPVAWRGNSNSELHRPKVVTVSMSACLLGQELGVRGITGWGISGLEACFLCAQLGYGCRRKGL